jgi:transcriptional regulator with XRE-family HTH domain
MTVADQIKKSRKAAKLSQQQLADEIGVTRSAINQWEKKAPKLRVEHKMALSRVLNRPASTFEEFGGGTVSPADGKRHAIRLLDWEDVKHLSMGGKMLKEALKSPSTYIDVGQDISKNAKALVVQDDSMSPVFWPGDEIIIDPDLLPKEVDGHDPDYVLVRVVKTGEEIFRRYVARRGVAYDLVAENADWDTVSISARNPGEMLGVLVEHRKKRRTS